MAHFVTLTELRPKLTKLIEATIFHDNPIIITRHGQKVAALVSMEQFARIRADEDYELYGPKNPATGRRPGAAWVKATGWVRPMRSGRPDGPEETAGVAAVSLTDLAAQAREMGAQSRGALGGEPGGDFDTLAAEMLERAERLEARVVKDVRVRDEVGGAEEAETARGVWGWLRGKGLLER